VSQDLQTARYDQLLRRVGALIGPGSKVTEVLGELFPMMDVENVPGELLRLMGTRIGMGGTTLAAVAAQIGKIQLFNPVGSGLLTTCTTIVSGTDGSGDITEYFLTATPLLTNVGNTPQRDTRDGVAVSTVTQVRSDTAAGGIPAHFNFVSVGNTPTTIQDPNGVVVLSPGTGITVAANTANRVLTVGFLWRERVAEPSELNL